MRRQFFFGLFVAGLFCFAHSQDIVGTLSGPVQGIVKQSYEGRPYLSFQGIPFAKPPIDELRFKEPQPIEPWQNMLVADKTYVCMQYTLGAPTKGTKGTEDCLYLNVYVPRHTITPHEQLPVVVYIHGGRFVFGDSKSIAGPDYLMDRDVILVTMNYRLGVLGFLSTCDAAAPGNYGLKDQVLAMKWVKDNIIYFGGDPNSITIAGAAAGAASVHFHYISPLTTGLFNRGYSQSGTALHMWALTKTPLENAKKLGSRFGCEYESSQQMVDCLRKVPVEDVVTGMSEFFTFINTLPETPFGPSVEPPLPGAYLPDHPYKLLISGYVQHLPWITSNVKDEGVITVGSLIPQNALPELDKRWNELSSIVLDYNDTVNDIDKTAVAKLIRDYYLGNQSISTDTANDLIRLFTDRAFFVDSIKGLYLQGLMSSAPSYYFFYEYGNNIPVPFKDNLSASALFDDTRLMFRHDDDPKVLSDSDRKMKNVFIDFLCSYATTGVPQLGNAPWYPIFLTPHPFTYVRITSPDRIVPDTYLDFAPFVFWQHLPILENERIFRRTLHFEQFLPSFH